MKFFGNQKHDCKKSFFCITSFFFFVFVCIVSSAAIEASSDLYKSSKIQKTQYPISDFTSLHHFTTTITSIGTQKLARNLMPSTQKSSIKHVTLP